jgi:hypothetical protein
LSKSDVTGEVTYKKVVNTFIRQTKAIYTITFEDGTILETTWNHPFRRLKLDATLLGGLQDSSSEVNQSMDLSEWTEARDLKSGDLMFTADGKLLTISSIEVDGREETVYNFEVEDFHTYFVGESGIWVHNQNYGQTMTMTGTALLPVAPWLGGALIGGGLLTGCYIDPSCRNGVATGINSGIEGVQQGWEDFVNYAEHTKNKTKSNKGKHEKGQARNKTDKGGEKGDLNRLPPRQKPPNHTGPWPPKQNVK